jgi:hypothetical protein
MMTTETRSAATAVVLIWRTIRPFHFAHKDMTQLLQAGDPLRPATAIDTTGRIWACQERPGQRRLPAI